MALSGGRIHYLSLTIRNSEQAPPALEMALSGGGETIFSVLKPGSHLRPHCMPRPTRHAARGPGHGGWGEGGEGGRWWCSFTAVVAGGSTNARLTCHLGLVVPAGCSIRCGDEWATWQVALLLSWVVELLLLCRMRRRVGHVANRIVRLSTSLPVEMQSVI